MSSMAEFGSPRIGAVGVTEAKRTLHERFREVRDFSMTIASPLSAEDCAIQTMPDVSPTRWHLAHTTWFFETFVLKTIAGYATFDDSFEYLFNSYYNTVGEQFPRHRRGTVSRPGLERTIEYRQHVDTHLSRFLQDGSLQPQQNAVVELGLQHEQQHQELMLTDIKHVLFSNPLFPSYHTEAECGLGEGTSNGVELNWREFDEQLVEIGFSDRYRQTGEFAFDNESPRHKTYLQQHEIADRCVTNREYLEFVESGGYSSPEHWLSLGWAQVQQDRWRAPLYWIQRDGQWYEFRLSGLSPLALDAPVCHVNYFEADAFARWAGCRLPTEFEWEHAQEVLREQRQDTGVVVDEAVFADRLFAEGREIHPEVETQSSSANLLGNLWQWTSSSYSPYPGFKPAEGALGEYNGKFMCNQYVLRGGSCATSSKHIRSTYRNFFPPEARWQFCGIRLAK